MKTKHTPGPWHTRHGQISSETSTHGCTIANCNATAIGISDEEVEANAALIAAAPEMAEALRECRIALTFYRKWMHAHTVKTPDDEPGTNYPFGDDCERKARSVLEKAGVQP